MMDRRSRLGISLAIVACLGSHATASSGTTLWRELATGMTPEEILPLVQKIEGVKRVKVLKSAKPDAMRRLDIDYLKDQIPIADTPFQLAPIFESGRLAQVLLASRDQCGFNIFPLAQKLVDGLEAKYPAVDGASELREGKVHDAERASAASGQPESLPPLIFANGEVAVFLTFRMQVERGPPYPYKTDKLTLALWQFAKGQFDQRKAQCGGTGDRRMDVLLQYLPRSKFDAEVEKLQGKIQEEKSKLIDGL